MSFMDCRERERLGDLLGETSELLRELVIELAHDDYHRPMLRRALGIRKRVQNWEDKMREEPGVTPEISIPLEPMKATA